jgi:hypothetical protein
VYLPGTADGRSVIELRLDSARGTGRVVLVGDDPQAPSARRERARRDGGFLVPPRQEGGFGDLALALRAAQHGRALQVFRYAFSGEKLVEATAAGRGPISSSRRAESISEAARPPGR